MPNMCPGDNISYNAIPIKKIRLFFNKSLKLASLQRVTKGMRRMWKTTYFIRSVKEK